MSADGANNAIKMLEGLRAEGGNANEVSKRTASQRVGAQDRILAAQDRISNSISNANSGDTTVNVTVPPGTPQSMANRVGQAAASGTRQSRKATRAALVHTGG